MSNVSTFRLYVLRAMYVLNFILLGSDVWPSIVGHSGDWETMRGVAFSFWAALSLVSGLGIRYPLQMVPLLLLQFTYKLIWITGIALPGWMSGRTTPLDVAFQVGIVLDLLVIPWGYVVRNFVMRKGERWRPASRGMQPHA